MMENTKKIATGHNIVAMAIIVSCSGQPEQETGQRDGPGGSDGNVAHASEPDAGDESGVGGASQPVMPDNPSHISFRFQRVPNVQVDYLSVDSYPHEVTEEGDKTIVTIFPPQGVTISVTFSPMGKDDKPAGEPITVTVEAEAKLGTYDLQFGETNQAIKFGDGVQTVLHAGENAIDRPSSEEYIAGSTSPVTHNVYKAEYDQVCHVAWTGTDEMRSFHYGSTQCHMEPVDFYLKKGQELGLYLVLQGGTQSSIFLEPREE